MGQFLLLHTPAVISNFQNSDFIWCCPMSLFISISMLELILIFLEDILWDYACVQKAQLEVCACFTKTASATFTGNVVDILMSAAHRFMAQFSSFLKHPSHMAYTRSPEDISHYYRGSSRASWAPELVWTICREKKSCHYWRPTYEYKLIKPLVHFFLDAISAEITEVFIVVQTDVLRMVYLTAWSVTLTTYTFIYFHM